MKKFITGFILILCVPLIHPIGANAQQIMLSRAVISSGGMRATNGQTDGTVTIAQPATGQATNGSMSMHYGFWTPGTAAARVQNGEPITSSMSLLVWPNPAITQTELTLMLPNNAPVTLAIYDAAGHQLAASTTQRMAGRSNISLDLSTLASGAYFVSASIPGEVVQQRFSVIR
jgi:hypothetical protein